MITEKQRMIESLIDGQCRLCGEPHHGENAQTIFFGVMPQVHQACYEGMRDNDPVYTEKLIAFYRRLEHEMAEVGFPHDHC